MHAIPLYWWRIHECIGSLDTLGQMLISHSCPYQRKPFDPESYTDASLNGASWSLQEGPLVVPGCVGPHTNGVLRLAST